MKRIKDIIEKSFDIVTFTIESSTLWIRKCIDILQIKTVRFPENPCSEIPLTDNQLPTINNNKLTTNKYQQYINTCENMSQNRKNTKMRKFIILLFSKLIAINLVQYWSNSYNFTENK
ncbi:hypothetical protein C6497_07225 [Candidatus Poribacteria bacterium]|nr:MAG: hypothetical protein C6497_07225 [Candidatus Poribacteria bacterium]